MHVTQTSGSNPFIAYALVNDGGQTGTGTGDVAFIASSKAIHESFVVSPKPTYQPHLAIWERMVPSCGNELSSQFFQLTNAPPNAPIQLIGPSAAELGGFLPGWAKTDDHGNFSTTGLYLGAPGMYNVAVEVGGLRSNSVSFVIPRRNEEHHCHFPF